MASAPRIRVNLQSPVPAQRQIVDALRVLLVEGQLLPGSALPSVRRLAMETGVHFNTVAEAYRQLAADGWLDLKHGRGAQVIERATPAAGREQIESFRSRLRQMAAQMRSEGIPAARIAAELRAMAEALTQ